MAGGLRSYNFHLLLEMYYLYSNQKSEMTKYKTFQSFGEFKTWADNTNDRELMIKILIVEKYQCEIPTILDKINERCRYDPENADYIFTSTHKAKGTVYILGQLGLYLVSSALPRNFYSVASRNFYSLESTQYRKLALRFTY